LSFEKYTHNKFVTPTNLIIVLTLIGFLIRFFNIDFNSIWLDEGSTFSFSHPSKSFMDIWALTASGEFNPPLFHWIEHIMLVAFGSTEIVLRFMPCVFGTLAIPVVYFIGKEIYSERVGIVSAFLVTISAFHVYYSQEARAYTLLMLIMSLFIYFYIKYKKTNSWKYAALVGVCASLGYWTHFWSLVVIAPIFVFMMVDVVKKKNKESFIPIGIASGIAIISTLPLTSVMVFLFNNRISTPSQWGMKDINLLIQYFSWIGYNNIITIAIFLLLIGMGFVIFYKLQKTLAIELGATCAFVLVVSVAISHTIPMLPRYMITLFPILYVVSGMAIVSLYVNYRKVAYLTLAIILIVGGLSLHTYYTTYTRENWKGYASELSKNTQGGDVIIVLPNYMRLALDFYYNNETDGTVEYGVYNSVDELMSLTSSKRTYYVFTWDISATDPDLTTVKWIEANAKPIGTYYGITTYVREPTT
jgi:mannosyltransferase